MSTRTIALILTLIGFGPRVTGLNSNVEKANIYFERAEQVFLTDFNDCIVNLKKALPIYEQYKYWTPYVKCLNGLFAVYYQKSDFKIAERFALSANKVANQYLDINSKTYNTAINNLGALYYQKRAVHKAIDIYEIALLNAHESTDATIPFIASIYHNISNCRILLGDYDAALENLYRAVAERKKSSFSNNLKIAEDYRSIGRCYKEKRHLNASNRFYHKSLLILNNLDNLKGDYIEKEAHLLMQNLAQIHLEAKHIDSALYFIHSCIAQPDLPSNNPNHYPAYEILAQIQLNRHDYERANYYFHIALDLLEQQSDELEYQHKKANILLYLGHAATAQNQFELALYYFQEALMHLSVDFAPRSLEQNPSLQSFMLPLEGLRILRAKAETFQSLYVSRHCNTPLIAAFNTYKLASNLIEKCRQNILTSGSKQQLEGTALPIYEGGIQTALELYQLSQNTDYLKYVYTFAERNKSILLLESVKEKLARNYGDLPNDLKEKEYTLRTDIAFYEQLLNTKKKQSPMAKTWRNYLFELKKDYLRLTKLLERKHPKYYKLKYATTPVTLKKLQANLDARTLVIEYFVGEQHIFAILISNKKISAFNIGQPNALKPKIQQFSKVLKGKYSSKRLYEEYTSLGLDLYHNLLQKGLQAMPSLFNRLVIIPDDILADFPFEALLRQEKLNPTQSFHPDHMDYLFEDFSISYSYSSTLFMDNLNTKRKKYEQPFLGLAPVFRSDSSNTLRNSEHQIHSNLKCASFEVDEIHTLIGGTLLKNQDAKLDYFKNLKQNYQIIHFATHAYADMEQPNLSKIYFSDQALLNRDIPMLDLPAELAVLSACNTGAGKWIKGEGVMSLSRAFMYAGCPSTLMSLWAVDDCEASKLMLLFYKKLKKGVAKDQALQEAKIEYLRTVDKAFQHTFYWSTFVLTGNYLPIHSFKPKRLPRGIFLMGISLLCFLCCAKCKF